MTDDLLLENRRDRLAKYAEEVTAHVISNLDIPLAPEDSCRVITFPQKYLLSRKDRRRGRADELRRILVETLNARLAARRDRHVLIDVGLDLSDQDGEVTHYFVEYTVLLKDDRNDGESD
jgi:hypothetical protein